MSDRENVATPHYRTGTGTPLVLLHPGGGSWRSWRPLLSLLGAHHDVFALTLPGHRGGPAFGRGEPVTLRTIANQVERDLDAVGIEDAHMVGNSLGGGTALELARRGRARSVVAFSPAAYLPSARTARLVLGGIELGLRSLRSPAVSWVVAPPQVRRHLLWVMMRHAERLPYAETLADLRACHIAPALLRGMLREGLLPPFDAGDVPIRIAWAEKDFVLPWRTFGAPLAQRIDGSEVVRLPGVGHVPMYDAPELVASTILAVTSVVDGDLPVSA